VTVVAERLIVLSEDDFAAMAGDVVADVDVAEPGHVDDVAELVHDVVVDDVAEPADSRVGWSWPPA